MVKIEIKWWERYWRLTLTWKEKFERRWKRNDRVRFVECICDCWNVVWVNFWQLRYKTRSCWCIASEVAAENWRKRMTTHWMHKTRIYHIYQWAESRCKNKKHVSYKYYWWKGIMFLWGRFEDFYKDMWESYNKHVEDFWEKDTTLDRINRNWHYCKENCKWSTWKEQMHNRDIVDKCGFNYTSIQWAKETSTTSTKESETEGEREKKSWSEL